MINNSGTWDEQTDASFGNDYGGAESRFVNLGSFLKSITAGMTTFQPGFNFSQSGRLQVQGGTITFNGGYSPTGGTLRFGRSSAGLGGQINIPAGTVALNDTLAVDLLNGYVPATGDAFTPLNYAAHTGAFGNFDLPPLAGGRNWQVEHGVTGVTLRVTGPPAASPLQISGVVTNSAGNPVAGAAVFAFVDPAATNPIQNGSFELPTNGGADAVLFGVGSTGIAGWTVVGPPGANVAVHSAFLGAAAAGVQYLDLTGATGSGGVTQSFPTVAGRKYALVFAHGAYSIQGSASVLSVTIGADSYAFGETTAGLGLHWKEEILPFTATGNQTAITFRDLAGFDANNNFVDAVRIVAQDFGTVLGAVTDAAGRYQFPVAGGQYQVGVHGLPVLGYNDPTNQLVTVGAASVVVNFAATTLTGPSYRVTAGVNPANAGTVTGAGHPYPAGATVTLAAVAATNAPWIFTSWTELGLLQSTNPTYNFTLSRDRQLVANFTLPDYQITATNQPADAGSVSGTGTFTWGTTNTLLAIPAFGYRFTNWTENGLVLATTPALTVGVFSNRAFVAHYVETNLSHVVSVATAPPGLATVTGAGTYTNGATRTFTAPAVVTNGPTRFVFQQFTLNGVAVANTPSYAKTFSTADPGSLQLVAEYRAQNILPLVLPPRAACPTRSGPRRISRSPCNLIAA